LNVICRTSIHGLQRRRLHQQRWVSLIVCLGGLLLVSIAVLTLALRSATVAKAAVIAANTGANGNERAHFDVAPGCLNLIEGGTFEQFNPSWQISASTRPPMYSNEQTFNGSLQALRLGNGVELPNIESVSEVRHKPILLPFGANRIILRFLYYPFYDAAPGEDLQQADLFDATTDQFILSLLNTQDNARAWKARDFDLTPYAGRSVSLRFRVRNDGGPGRTLLYLDNVELEYCAQAPLPTFTPTPLPTASGTPIATSTLTPLSTLSPLPTTPVVVTSTPIVVTSVPLPPEDPSCPNILVNGSFEGFDGWHFGEDPVPARYVSNFVQDGVRAVLLGNPPENPTNVVTFSSIRQLVTIPFSTGGVQLRWWRLLQTAQAGTPTSTTDRQDLILLAPNLRPIQILRRELRNDGVWQEDAVDLTSYRGQSVYIYFNAFNDANTTRTLMVLDNVRLRVCGAPAVLPPVMTTPIAATPVAIPVTPNLTYTVIPLPSITLSVIAIMTPLPTITATVAAAFAPPATPTAIPPIIATAIPPAPATPTNNVYALPTLPTQTVVGSATVPAGLVDAPAIKVAATPVAVVTIPVANGRPIWMDRLGAVAILSGILVLIGFIVLAIVRMFQRRP